MTLQRSLTPEAWLLACVRSAGGCRLEVSNSGSRSLTCKDYLYPGSKTHCSYLEGFPPWVPNKQLLRQAGREQVEGKGWPEMETDLKPARNVLTGSKRRDITVPLSGVPLDCGWTSCVNILYSRCLVGCCPMLTLRAAGVREPLLGV